MFKDLPEGQTHCYTPEEMVICPNCAASFRAIPEDVQAAIATKQAELINWKFVTKELSAQHTELERKNAVLVAELDAAKARIAEAEKQEPVTYGLLEYNDEQDGERLDQRVYPFVDWAHEHINEVLAEASLEQCGWLRPPKVIPLFTRPPITSQRELELLAVIEQMREELRYINEVSCGDCELVDVQDDTEAMAYINEHISEFLDKEGESLTTITETDSTHGLSHYEKSP